MVNDKENEVTTEDTLIKDINESNSYVVYEVCSEEDVAYFAAGMLDVLDDDFRDGEGVGELCENNSSYRILYTLFSLLYSYTINSTDVSEHKPGFTIIQEENYVDRVYRDSYYFYYSGKNFTYSRYCKRLILFAKVYPESISILDLNSRELSEDCAGSIVIRPLINKIGRSFLNPKYFLEGKECFIRLTEFDITVYGKRLSIKAFPFSMQDGETTTCAEITILNLLDYYSKNYAEYHYLLPSEIHDISLSTGFQRSLPSQGLKYEMISKIFCEAGFWPRLYYKQKINADKMRRILYYYIESGIPLSLGVDVGAENKHSVIVIGHGEQNKNKEFMKKNISSAYNSKARRTLWLFDAADSVRSFCVMDDNNAPYNIMTCEIREKECVSAKQLFHTEKGLMLGEHEIVQMMVPLYKKMYLEASDASDLFKIILASDELGINQDDFTSVGLSKYIGSKDNPLTIRIFMASTRGFTRQRDEEFIKNGMDAASWYYSAVFPRFVWVCEISTIDNNDEVIGELVMDATAAPSDNVDALIIVHYPKRIYCKLPTDASNNEDVNDDFQFHKLSKWSPFTRYKSNLDVFFEKNDN